jgi:hypothetical protein
MSTFNLRLSDFASLSFERKIDLLEEVNRLYSDNPNAVFWIEGRDWEGKLDWDFVGHTDFDNISKGALWDYFSASEIIKWMGSEVVDLFYGMRKRQITQKKNTFSIDKQELQA